MEEYTIVCTECESECIVKVLESEFNVSFCPICGEELGTDD